MPKLPQILTRILSQLCYMIEHLHSKMFLVYMCRTCYLVLYIGRLDN